MACAPAAKVLALWEAGSTPLALLEAGAVGERSALAQLPIGERDSALIALGRELFGTAIEATILCPHCGETAELTLDSDDLLAIRSVPGPVQVVVDEWQVAARAVDSNDLSAIAGLDDPEVAARQLVIQAVTACSRAGIACDPRTLPDPVIAAIDQALAAIDPLSSIEFTLDCPQCALTFPALFDPACHLAESIAVAARRLLSEVATLVRAFGWHEHDILAMSSKRRAVYFELAT
jgi:hypothetical protein